MKSTVSIIMPIYNVEGYVEKSLRSAFNQTYENIEYVLIDDCGTDKSMEKVFALLLLDEYKDKVVKVIKHECNKGVSAARNTGVLNSSSEFIYFMDSDDVIVPNCIELHINAIKKNRVDFTIGGVETVGSKTIHIRKLNAQKLEGTVLTNFFKRTWDPGPWNKLIRKSFLLNNNIVFTEGIRFEDILWSYYMAKKANTVELIEFQTYKYIVHQNSFVTSKNSVAKVNDMLTVIKTINEDYVDSSILALREKYISFLKFNASLLLLNFNGTSGQKKDLYNRIQGIACSKQSVYDLILRLPYWLFNMLFAPIYMTYKKFQ